MSYRLYAPKRNPLALWMLDDTSPYQEHGGLGYVGNTKAGSGPATQHAAIVAGAGWASCFSQAKQGEFNSPVFKQGSENQKFALEAWVNPVLKSRGQTVQKYTENLAGNPTFNNTQPARLLIANGTTTYTMNNVKVTAGGTATTYVYVYSAQGVPASRINGITVGDRIGFYYKITALRDCTLLVAAAAYDITGAGAAGTTLSYPNPSGTAGRTYNMLAGETKWVGTVAQFTETTPGSSNMAAILPLVYFYPYGGTTGFLTAGDTANITNVIVENYGKNSTRINPPDYYYDGNSAGYEWAGTAHASNSRTMNNVSRVNLLTNPGAEVAGGWSPNNGTNYTVTRDTTVFRRGVASIKSIVAVSQNTIGSLYAFGMNASTKHNVFPGEVYTLSYYAKAGQAGAQGQSCLIPYDNSGTTLTLMNGPAVPLTSGVWTRVSATFTIPANCYTVYTMGNVTRVSGSASIGEFVHFDDALFERSASVGSAFLGSDPGAGYTAGANTSPSLLYSSSAPQKVLSHAGAYDGLTMDGSIVRFSTEYLTSGRAECSYDLNVIRAAHIVGVHNAQENSLFVDGEMVASVKLTDDQKGDSYIATDGKLYSGETLSSQEVAVNGVAIYAALTPEQIKQNFDAGRRIVPQAEIAPQFGGEVFNLNSDMASVYLNQDWTSGDDFKSGRLVNVNINDTGVYPDYAAGVSLAGSWTVGVALDSTGLTSIYGVMVEWSAGGVTVEGSIDGTNWSTLRNGELVSMLPVNSNPTGRDLEVRFTFAGGLADDPAYVEYVRVVGYSDATVANGQERVASVLYPAVLRDNYEPILMREDNGINLGGGFLLIGPDTSTANQPLRTLEMWVKPHGPDPLVFSLGGWQYRNGAADTTMPIGEWSLIHFVLGADNFNQFQMSGQGIVGQVTYYDTALSAANIAHIYKSYTGRPVIAVNDTGSITVTEPNPPHSIYAHDWSIDGGGG